MSDLFRTTRSVVRQLEPLRREVLGRMAEVWRAVESDLDAALEEASDSFFDPDTAGVNVVFGQEGFRADFNLPEGKSVDAHSITAEVSPEGNLVISGKYQANNQAFKIPVRGSTE